MVSIDSYLIASFLSGLTSITALILLIGNLYYSKKYELKEPSHKKKLGRACLGFIFASSLGGCGCWALAHVMIIFDEFYFAVLNGVFVVAYIGFGFCMFLKILFSWLHIIVNYGTNNKKLIWLVEHETLVITITMFWVIFFIVISNVLMWKTQVYSWTWIGIGIVAILPVILSIGVLFSFRRVITLLKNLLNDQKRKRFKGQFIFITIIFLSMFDLLILYTVLHLFFARETLVISDWFTVWIPQTITFGTMFWFFNPFKSKSKKGSSITLEGKPSLSSVNIIVS